MTPRPLTLWVVEDDKNDAMKAAEVIKRAIPEERYTAFWDRTLIWSADVTGLPHAQEAGQFCKLDHMPDIVILDLLDENLEFAAGRFYEELRKEERNSELPASFVIMWSVKTGMSEVHQFVERKLKTDRRLMFTNTKTLRLLEENLIRCVGTWREAQLL